MKFARDTLTFLVLGSLMAILVFASLPLGGLALEQKWGALREMVEHRQASNAGTVPATDMPLPIPNQVATEAEQFGFNSPLPTNTAQPCVARQQWPTYMNEKGGYSLQYPPDSNVNVRSEDEAPDFVSLRVLPRCYQSSCSWYTVEILTLSNSERLPIEVFVSRKLARDAADIVRNHETIEPLKNGARFIQVGTVKALRFDDGSGQHPAVERLAGRFKPVIFIPNDDRVLQLIVRSGRAEVPPFSVPCRGMLTLLDEMLSTVQFSSH